MRRPLPPIVLRSPFLAAVSSDLPSLRPSVCLSVRSSGGGRFALRGRRRRRPRDRPRPLHLNARARPPHLEARAHFFGRARESSHDEHVCVSQLFEALSKRFISTKSLMWLPVSLYIPEGAELNKSLLTRDTSSTLPGSRSRQLSVRPFGGGLSPSLGPRRLRSSSHAAGAVSK